MEAMEANSVMQQTEKTQCHLWGLEASHHRTRSFSVEISD